MRVVNTTKSTVLAERCRSASTFWQRLKGLLGAAGLADGEGLVINGCNSVHTLFMRFPIDVVFLSGEGAVVQVIPCLKPFRITALYGKSNKVVELPAGTIRRTSTVIGDSIRLE